MIGVGVGIGVWVGRNRARAGAWARPGGGDADEGSRVPPQMKDEGWMKEDGSQMSAKVEVCGCE